MKQKKPQIEPLQVIGNNLCQPQKPGVSDGAIINGFRFYSSRGDQDARRDVRPEILRVVESCIIMSLL